MNIQWYPGHMTKTRRMIAEQIKNVDAVCEILDARIPVSSRNPDVDELTAGKPRLVVLNRVDQADRRETKRWAAYFRGKGYAVLEANAKGGVLGKKIELVAQDDQCKPELATNAATKLISDKVVAIMGPICSGATNASLPMYESANIISISPTATTPALTLEGKHPLFLRTVANDNAQAQLTSSYIIEVLKAKKVAYLHDNGEYGKGFAQQNRGILEKAGVETVLFEAVTPDAVDFSAVVRKLRPENN